MSRITIGLDLSYTNTAIAVVVDGLYDKGMSRTVGTTPKDGTTIQRIKIIENKVLEVLTALDLSEQDPDIRVAIEGYAFGRMQNRELLGELGGVIKYELVRFGFAWEAIPVTAIRKIICGKGNAKKELVMMSLLKNFGLEIPQNDQADAAAVALACDKMRLFREHAAEVDTWAKELRESVKTYAHSSGT